MKKITFLAIMVFCSIQGYTQKAKVSSGSVPLQRTCGTMKRDSILRANNPSMGTLQDFENALQQVMGQIENERSARSVPYDIPTIVHVIHNGTAVGSGLNLSQAQIYSQYDVLNNDYNGLNADTSLIPAAFVPVKGSLQMNFKKALRNPSGVTLAEPGINRINRNTMGWTAPPYSDNYIDGTIKPASIWDPTKYFNVWVTDISGGLLGWAQFPPQPTPSIPGLPAAGAANTDGVVVLYSAFGTVGNISAPYNKGRTLTHEAGHFFGLRHIWGDEALCAQDDYVNDTPLQKDKNFGCPTYPQTTGAGGRCNTSDPSSMFMNFMDYTDDACMFMFTDGQATRMEAVVTSSPRRNELTTSTTATPSVALDASISNIINPTGSSCVTTFSPVVTLMNYGSTTLTSVTITYNIDGTGSQTYNWTGSLVSGASTNVTLASMTTTAGAHTFNATTSAPNGGTDGNTANNSRAQSFTITSAPAGVALPFTENFASTTFPPTGWTLSNPNANETFARVTTTGAFGATPLHAAKMDNYAGNTDISGQLDILTTPSVNLSTANSTLKMTFAVAYAKYDASTNDSLFIEVSTDCGSTWTKVYGKGGAGLQTANPTTTAFTPTAAQWRRDTVYLSSYAGNSNAQFRFRNLSAWGNNLYIDDINLASSAAAPVAAFTASQTSTCAGSSVTFTDQSTNTPTSWSWSFPGGTPSTSTTQNPTVTYAAAGTYSVTLTASNGTGNNSLTKTGYIVVNALPTITSTPSTSSICVGSSASLTGGGAGAGGTYTWNPGAMSGATVSVNPTSTTTYTVTGTNSNGCRNTTTAAVTVNTLPTVTSSSATSICAGSSATLQAGGASTYTWNPGSMSGATVVVTPASTATYTVTGTNSNGCRNTASTIVTVNSLPTITATPASPTICAGNSVSLTASGAGSGGSYTWTPGTLTGATVTVSPTATTTYTVTGTNSNGCRNSTTKVVTVNQNPTVTATGATICSGSSATLSASGATTYTWSPATGLSSTTGSTVTSSATSTTTYTLTGVSNGCSGTSTTVVNVSQPATAAAGTDASICAGNSYSLSGMVGGAASSSTWTSSGTGSFGNPNAGSTTYSPSSADISAGSVVLTITSNDPSGPCGAATDAMTLTISPSSNASFSYAANTYCQNDADAMPTVSSTGGTFSSSPSGLAINPNTGEILVGSSTAGVYTVTHSISGMCPASSTTTVVINATPTAAATATPDSTIIGSTVTFNNSSSGASSYSWDFGDGGSSTSSAPTHIYSSPGLYTVTMTATNGNCSATTTMTVEIVDPNGMLNNTTAGISLYPNPSTGLVYMQFASSNVSNVKVMNSIGQVAATYNVNGASKLEVDLSSNASGLYYILVTETSGQTTMMKLSVKH